MIKQKPTHTGPIEIELTGPDGNAYALMEYARRFARQLDLDGQAIVSEMMEGDYEHLIAVFDKHFGTVVTLLR
jgi:hypothetical protein